MNHLSLSMSTYFLYDCSVGYVLFEIKGYEDISQNVTCPFVLSINNL